MTKFRLSYHDFVYGRVSFTTTVSANSMIEADKTFRQSATLPSYIVCYDAERLEN